MPICRATRRSGHRPDRPPSAVVGRNDPRPRYANVAIIEGDGASRYGIGMVSARIAEIVLRDKRAVIPIGCYNPAYGVTMSLPAIVGRWGVIRVLEPAMFADECQALQRSADTLRSALAHVGGAMGFRRANAAQQLVIPKDGPSSSRLPRFKER